MISNQTEKLDSSFRDPSGFVFARGGNVYRQVNLKYKDNYDLLKTSGLYENLTGKGMLICHEEVSAEPFDSSSVYKVLKPYQMPFISYPSEWCFSQLKDAASLTMDVVLEAIDKGMILKDASAYNVQFDKGRPILIDTLSFEKYVEGAPWVGYRQFCQHFLAPLSLMAYRDTRLCKLLSVHVDGIPLDLASSLLPNSSWFNRRLLSHLHLHSRWQGQSGQGAAKQTARISKDALKALLQDLKDAVGDLKLRSNNSLWADYTTNNNYEVASAQHKKKVVAEFIDRINPKKVIDLGANIGDYSRFASRAEFVISADFDHDSVEMNYKRCGSEGINNILPLVVDLTNPTPAFGFENKERLSFIERGKADLVMALALIHHLAIANNVPLSKVAHFLNCLGGHLIVEFVSKDDSQVTRLLESREDIFDTYNQASFEQAFQQFYDILACEQVEGTKRQLYLMQSRGNS